jgi:muconolactone D-isomerase
MSGTGAAFARSTFRSASLLGDKLEERRNQLRATLPIGRLVEPADVARLAIHLMANTVVGGVTCGIDRRVKARRFRRQQSMEFLVEFKIDVPEGTPESEVEARESAEAAAAARLVNEGHLVRVWKRAVAPGETNTVLGLYRADSEAQLADLLGALPLYDWMQMSVTALEPHPNDPAVARS